MRLAVHVLLARGPNAHKKLGVINARACDVLLPAFTMGVEVVGRLMFAAVCACAFSSSQDERSQGPATLRCSFHLRTKEDTNLDERSTKALLDITRDLKALVSSPSFAGSKSGCSA